MLQEPDADQGFHHAWVDRQQFASLRQIVAVSPVQHPKSGRGDGPEPITRWTQPQAKSAADVQKQPKWLAQTSTTKSGRAANKTRLADRRGHGPTRRVQGCEKGGGKDGRQVQPPGYGCEGQGVLLKTETQLRRGGRRVTEPTESDHYCYSSERQDDPQAQSGSAQ